MNVRLPLGSIVVGVDGSAPSLDALSWATRQAVLERRPLVIAHGSGEPVGARFGGTHGSDTARQIRRIAGRRHVDHAHALARRLAPDLGITTLARTVAAKQLLLELADHAHLVVLGSRGLGPLGSVALGSVSVAVTSGASVPVVVVRAPEPRRRTSGVLVGTDATAASTAALEFAFAFASAQGAALTAVHCSHAGVTSESAEHRFLSESVAGLREKYVDVAVTLRVVTVPPAAYLVEASRYADLVVVGARSHHPPGASLLGSVSQRVVERAHSSVAVVHPPTVAT